MPPSALSTEVSVTTGPAPVPAAPAISASSPNNDNNVVVVVTLPSQDANGNPLAALSNVAVFYSAGDMAGQTADQLAAAAAAPAPTVFLVNTPITLAQAGQQISVPVTGLAYDTQYFFVADVS